MRSTPRARNQPPVPSGKRDRSSTNWVTLREAESVTSVPVNTLRKWSRKGDVPSYLESDGDVALRMVDLDAVVDRAEDLGRTVEPHVTPSEPEESRSHMPAEHEPAASAAPPQEPASEGTMIVPIDAWNKMLNQLGNLHEAGQQLAEARERAAKAETEATFLRERLAEIRASEKVATSSSVPKARVVPLTAMTDVQHVEVEVVESTAPDPTPESSAEMTPYWRYLTTGWRDRKKRRGARD